MMCRWHIQFCSGYYVGDFRDFDFGDEKFDLVVTHTGMIYFDMEYYFKRISELLKPGGSHFLMDINWYHIHGTVMYLPLDAPWLHVRMTKADLLRYYKKKHPEMSAFIDNAFYWKNSHYTPADVVACASRYGLQAISLRRFFDPASRNQFSYRYPKNLAYVMNTVLPDARALNSTVEVVDLHTFTFTIVFRKVFAGIDNSPVNQVQRLVER
jgi:SAM-dependent methyltransferase